jgi:prevent-host-death family protein
MFAVNITEFRKHLPEYLKKIQQGEEIQITNRGKIIARVVPENDAAEAARKRLFALRGKGYLGDVISPLEAVEWTADEDNL